MQYNKCINFLFHGTILYFYSMEMELYIIPRWANALTQYVRLKMHCTFDPNQGGTDNFVLSV